MIDHLIFTVIVSFGLSVLLVEKRFNFPIRKINTLMRYYLRKIVSRKFSNVMTCTVCFSFWATFIVEICNFVIFGQFYFPLTGFATVGVTWTIIELLNAIDNG